MTRQIYVNLAVSDLQRAKAFFAKLGFEFNPKFTDDKAACMVIGPDAFVMLLAEPFFETFTKRKICDTSTQTEALLALSCATKEEVDTMVKTAVANGGAHAMEPLVHDFMYGWSFYDPDGHHWEVMSMKTDASSD